MSSGNSRKTSANKYGFKARKQMHTANGSGTPNTRQRPSTKPQAPMIPSRVNARKHKTVTRKPTVTKGRQRWNGPERTEMFPIHTPEDSFAIKTEGGIRVSNGVHGLPRTPIKVEDYDSRPTRGYATFTSIQKLLHNTAHLNRVAREQQTKWGVQKAAANQDTQNAEDAEDVEVEDDSWIDYDGEWAMRASSETPYPDIKADQADEMSPNPSKPLLPEEEPMSDNRLLKFERVLRGIIFGRGFEKVLCVIKTINTWLAGSLVVYRDGEGMWALRQLERKGELRIQGDTVFWPEAYGRMEPEIKLETVVDIETAAQYASAPCPNVVADRASPALAPYAPLLSRPQSRAPSYMDLARANTSSHIIDLGSPSPSPPPTPAPHSPIQGYDLLIAVASEQAVGPYPSRISPARCAEFRSILGRLLTATLFIEDDCAPFEFVLEAVNEVCSAEFSVDEADQALEALSDKNAIMYTGGHVYKL